VLLRCLLVITTILASFSAMKPAWGQEKGAGAPALLKFEEAEKADAAFDLERAAIVYADALRLDPTLATAMRAEQRAKILRARSEGNYQPLAALERVRRDPKLASDTNAIDELVRSSESWPVGLVRVETWVLASEAYANRLNRPADAVPLRRRIMADEKADNVTKLAAAKALSVYFLARSDFENAEAIAASPIADTKLRTDIRRVIRRHRLHIAAIALTTLTLLFTIVAFVRRRDRAEAAFARLRESSRLVIGYGAYVAIGGAILASSYEAGTSRPFLWLGITIVPVLFLARAWGVVGRPDRAARAMRAALCAASALGVSFLVLEGIDVAYLEGLGL